MKTKTVQKRLLSIFLAVLMAVGSIMPALSAFAEDESGGVVGIWDLSICYENGVPVHEEGEKNHIEYMKEGEKVQMQYQLKDCTIPDNGWIEWNSDTPTVCDVTPEGLVRAFDSSKGAAVRLWLDNEVATVPVVGKLLKAVIEKALFNDSVNIDTMDVDQIIAIIDGAFGEDSALAKYFESYKAQLIESLKEYLDKVNTTISCTMYDKDGKPIAEDSYNVCVQKSDELYADLIPNGTHITNKGKLPTTVAKGSTLQLNACTTPTRLHMGVIYSVKNSSIFSSGKVVATVDSTGLVTFKNTGTVTIVVSPDTEGFIDNLLKYVNKIVSLPDANGKVDTGKLADILIKYVGLDINRTVLVGILDACFVIADIAGDTANPVQLTKTAAKVLANIIYQFTTNDSITFTVVDGVPVTDFEISGTSPTEKVTLPDNTDITATPVKEGDFLALGVENVKPEAADISDIIWTSSDPATASVDPVTGVVTARDVGTTEVMGIKTPKTKSDPVLITATSKANNVSKSVYVIVTQKIGEYITDAEIIAERTSMNLGETQQLEAKIYPERRIDSRYLHLYWGAIPADADPESYVYNPDDFAKEPFEETDADGNPVLDADGSPVINDGTATDGIGKIDSNGVYTAVAGGTSTIVLRAVTGLETFGNFNQISEVFAFIKIDNGKPVESIALSAEGLENKYALDPIIKINEDKDLNGELRHYVTVDYGGSADGLAVVVRANIAPDDATNKKVIWDIDNKDNYDLDDRGDGTCRVVGKLSGNGKATTVHLWCKSADGDVTSSVMTITFSKSHVEENIVTDTDKNPIDNLDVINGKTSTVSHDVKVDGKTDKSDACYAADWFSDDEEIAYVESVDEDGNAVIRGTDVGVTTLHCLSADGAKEATCTVTVHPDKSNLLEIIDLCEKTTLRMTPENEQDYDDFLYQLDSAYYIAQDVDLASQTVVDNTAADLLYLFYKLGGYVGINGLTLLDKDGNEASDYISVNVSTSKPYTSAKYALGCRLNPVNSMYKSIVWKSSNESAVTVDRYGVCRPVENSACYSTITVTVTDYFGNQYSDSAVVAFANTNVSGITVSPDSLTGQKVGGTPVQLEASLSPKAGIVTTANIKDVIWKSSDEGVAKVTADSKDSRKATVEFIYGGDCVITATTADGGLVAECAVNVETNYDPLIEAINKYTNLALPETSYYPDSYKVYTDALAEGQAMVDAKASTQNEVKAMVEKIDNAYKGLQKYNYITNIEIYREGSPTSDYYQYDVSVFSKELLYTNVEFQLNVRLYPNNASYKEVIWSCDNPNISIDENGYCKVTENKPQVGVVTCTVTDHFGHSWSDDVNVAITRFPVTKVELDKTEIVGAVGETEQLTPIIYPRTPDVGSIKGSSYATYKDVMWESDNEAVATVDENGLVTFAAAGATVIRVRTLDGGYTAECFVSTEGDRSALVAAIDKYKDVVYTDYTYEYGMAFKQAYEKAQAALTDNSLTQSGIDAAAQELETAGAALAGNEFIGAQTISLNYKTETQANRLASWKEAASGTIADDAAAYSYKTEDKSLVDTKTTVSAFFGDECKANYTDIKWETVSKSSDAKVEISGTDAVVKAEGKNTAYAVLKASASDVWGRAIERTIRVVIAPEIVTGITLDQTSVTKPVTSQPFTLTATVNPSGAKVTDITWSSSDESVATVENGVVTPVNTGTCVITAETADGGYKAECTVTFETDYSALTDAYVKYDEFISGVLEEHIYTTKSLAVLQQAVTDANEMILNHNATQAQVDEMVNRLNDAFNNLVLFVGVTEAQIILPEGQQHVTMPNDGYIRYQATVINNASFNLESTFLPEDASPEEPVWSSSNSNITVENGVVTKSGTANAEYGVITVTYTDEAGNSASASVNVSFVRTGVESISFGKEAAYGRPGTTEALSPSFSPALASIRSCIYESSAPEIASVDENGVITFNSKGEAIITVTAVDGGYTASITAYTTADTSALSAAIEEYSSVNYMDYAYEYGTAFKAAYEQAQAVYADYLAEQQAVDEATANLQTAYNALAGNEFAGTGEIKLMNGSKALENGMKLAVDENNQLTITADYNKDAMLKSAVFTVENANGVEAEITEGGVVITKTTADASGTVDVVFTVTDDYDRQTTVTRSLIIVDAIVPISSFKFVYNGVEKEEGETVDVSKTSRAQLNGATVQLGINIYPENAEEPTQILWTADGASQITVDQNGLVKMGIAASKSYSSIITCTIILSDGTTVSNSITVNFTSKY